MIFIDEKMWCVVCAELETWRLLARGGKKGATILLLISEVSFATSYASKIYVNLKVDYITSLIQKFATMSAGVQTIERSNVNNIPIEEEMFLNRMNIKELLDYDWSPELEEYIVIMRGETTKIDNRFGWYYISYNACSKKIEPVNGVYNCSICNKKCKFPLVKYKIHVKVKDKTGESSVVLFNVVAEKLLDTSAHKLFSRLSSSDNNDVPAQIQSLIGKDFIFKLKLNSYNLQEGLENFTVSKIFILVENLEMQYQSRKDKKGKSLLGDEKEPEER
uniref:Uncharacterized protein LOC104235438 isoform X1 n=2 Tax=Nicotiana sylvestris TaxID=4096 RepID=A0A1U7XLX9_NICSY|nr:PREDICTED: uncharacterized protein LOC104235438 isoform X1 [Nicotiana sylvestris]